MYTISKRIIQNVGRVLGFCTLLFFYSVKPMAQRVNSKNDSIFLYKKSNLKFGLGLGYGLTTIRKEGYNLLLRPAAAMMLRQNILSKNQLLYKAMFRSFGYNLPSGSSNGVPYSEYVQLDFSGLSLTYLHAIFPKKPLFVGIGLSAEILLKDRAVTIFQDGRRYSNPSYETFKTANWSGQLVAQYQPKIAKRLRAMIELEYSFGLLNFFKPIATQMTGRKAYSSGVFVNIGVFF